MARKKRMLTNREWWAKHREQFERTDRLLKERIAYHEAKLAEERAARGEADAA
jgi:hypothetical protein